MLINYAILGILSYKPLSGYDLKKLMQEISFMYWTGNNNQIYKTLLELNNEGYVTNEIYNQTGAPAKKIYTITEAGLSELKRLSLEIPQPLELKKSFLVQLAWSWQLKKEEINNLFIQYEQEIRGLLYSETLNKEKFLPDRTPRETSAWNLIYENIITSYETELLWIKKAREKLTSFEDAETKLDSEIKLNEKEKNTEMSYSIIENNNLKYIYLDSGGAVIKSEHDALDLITYCFEAETNLLLIDGERFSEDFYRLKTGLAGAVLQKLAQYNIKTAVIFENTNIKGKFADFMIESNRGEMFNSFIDKNSAENWLFKI